jgi:hypothetical protein
VELKWEGKGSDGEDVKGTVKVPEVSHEAIDGLSDYVVSPGLLASPPPHLHSVARAIEGYLSRTLSKVIEACLVQR